MHHMYGRMAGAQLRGINLINKACLRMLRPTLLLHTISLCLLTAPHWPEQAPSSLVFFEGK